MVRGLLAVLSLLLLPSAGGPPTPSNPLQRISFAVRGNKVLLPVTIGGSRPLSIILDSGMAFDGVLIYNSALADSIELRNPFQATLGGAGSGPPQTALVADSMSFHAGDVPFEHQRIILLEGDAMKGFSSDGVCGHSLFGSHAVEINYDRMEIVLHPPGSLRPDSTWMELPLTFKENRIPWTELSASIGGADVETLSCYIDLASSETVEFLTRDGMKFTLPDSLEEVYLGRGLSGDIRGQRGRIAWVGLGPHRVNDLEVAFTPAEVRSKQPGADAVIGNGLLRRFNSIFDYRTERMYLKAIP
jgi:hypothetical protein